MGKKKDIAIDFKVTMQWYNLKNKELKKIAEWLDKVPKEPFKHSEE